MGAYAIPLVFFQFFFKHTNAGHIITTHKQRFGHVNATNRNSYLNIITQVKKLKELKFKLLLEVLGWSKWRRPSSRSFSPASKDYNISCYGVHSVTPVGHPPQKERYSGQTQEVHYYYYYTGRGSLIGVLHEVEWQIVTATVCSKIQDRLTFWHRLTRVELVPGR